MKKFLFLMVAVVIGMVITGCSSCKSEQPKQEKDTTVSAEVQIATDREYVFLNYGHDYKWYESEVRLVNYMDEDYEFEIDELVNIFQYQKKAIKCQHFDGITEYGWTYGIWVGDFDLSFENVVLTFKEAFERMKQSNYVLPHSRYCTLRREVGPKPNVNPQYIFGNTKRQIYVDAVTGEVTDKNPAYDEVTEVVE